MQPDMIKAKKLRQIWEYERPNYPSPAFSGNSGHRFLGESLEWGTQVQPQSQRKVIRAACTEAKSGFRGQATAGGRPRELGDPSRPRVTMFHSTIAFFLSLKEKDRSSDFHCYDLLDASECMFDKKK